MAKSIKRILTVSIVKMHDDSPDTSYLGEYSNSPTSPYSIDRAHDLDCPQQTYNGVRDVDGKMMRLAMMDQLERIHNYLCGQYNAQITVTTQYNVTGVQEYADWYNLSSDFISEHIDSLENECTCGNSWNMRQGEYRYFNPSPNYVDAKGKRLPENTPDDVIKYVKQDYQRMESLNDGSWSYMGIRAEASIREPYMTEGRGGRTYYKTTSIESGGVWGIESDGDDSYFTEVEQEELGELRSQLKALGFSTRAISKAFKSIEHKDGN